MKYNLDENSISILKERLQLQSDIKAHQIYPNIFDLNIKDFIVNEEIIINYVNNKEPKESIDSMIESFKNNKSFAPLIVDKNNYLIDGYHRYIACLNLGIDTIPVIKLNVTLSK